MKAVEELLQKIKTKTDLITFQEVIETVDNNYEFIPTAFKNGDTFNEENQNNGSCKVFAFGKLNNLSASETLQLFGDFYRKDVLENPEGDDHQNIRNFIQYGWAGIFFETEALIKNK